MAILFTGEISLNGPISNKQSLKPDFQYFDLFYTTAQIRRTYNGTIATLRSVPAELGKSYDSDLCRKAREVAFDNGVVMSNQVPNMRGDHTFWPWFATIYGMKSGQFPSPQHL